MMIIMISLYSFFAYKFDVLLDYTHGPCYCYCVYYLNQNEMFLILLTLYSTIITTALAMPRWLQEATYNSPYLYLITYQLPMIIATKHNETNPAFSIPLQNVNQVEPLQKSASIQNEGDNNYGAKNPYINTSDNNVNKITIYCRKTLIGFGYLVSSIIPSVLLLTIAITNYYGYRQTALIFIGILGIILGIFSILIPLNYIIKKCVEHVIYVI